MNSLILSSVSSIEESVNIISRLDKLYTKTFNRAMSLELFSANTFIAERRDENTRVEIIAKWDREHEAEAKRDLIWLKENL